MKTAIFPGSFDPITNGHVEIIRRGKAIFDKIIVAIGVNAQKERKALFTLQERMEMLHLTFDGDDQIEVAKFSNLTIEFARERGAGFLLRGLRSPQDLIYEQPIELINKHMAPELETVHLLSSPETAMISSTIVREVIKYRGHIAGLIPDEIADFVSRSKYA